MILFLWILIIIVIVICYYLFFYFLIINLITLTSFFNQLSALNCNLYDASLIYFFNYFCLLPKNCFCYNFRFEDFFKIKFSYVSDSNYEIYSFNLFTNLKTLFIEMLITTNRCLSSSTNNRQFVINFLNFICSSAILIFYFQIHPVPRSRSYE